MATNNLTTPLPDRAAMRPTTGAGTQKAIMKLKTAGAFVAGGLASAVVVSGLMHGWDALTANGLINPFADGDPAALGTDAADRVGFSAKPTASGTANSTGLDTFVPVTVVPVAVALVGAASASPAMPAPAATPRVAEAGAASQPVAATVTIPSGWAANVRQAAVKADQPVRHNAAPLAGAPDTVQRTGFPAASKQPVGGTPSKHKQADVAGTGDWIGALMPGKPAVVAYYTPTAAGTHSTGDYWVDGQGKVLHAATAADRRHFEEGARMGMVRQASMADVAGIVDVPEWQKAGKPNGYAISSATRGAGHVLAGAALGYVKSLSMTEKLGWGDK